MNKMDAEYFFRLKEISKLQDPKPKLEEFLKSVEPKKTRTENQNNAIHKDCELVGNKLNDAGYDMKKVLKIDIPWTTESVKEYIIKPIMKALYQKESTTELEKQGEINKLHDVVMRELGEKFGIEYHDFPHEEEESIFKAPDVDYPEDDSEPEF